MPYKILEIHFKSLDACELGDNKIFKSQADKERYESYLMFAFRKFMSLDYHLNNVDLLFQEEVENLAKRNIELPDLQAAGSISFTMKSTKDSYEFIYELSAYLSALKSCLDMLSEAASYYLKGIDTNWSISPLLKLVKKKESSILEFTQKNETWLKNIRDYRHPIVHRLVLQSKSGYEIHQNKGKNSKVIYPILIPQITPKFVADTRRQRIMDDHEDVSCGFMCSKQKCTVSKDGIEEVVDFKNNIDPAPGYVRIEDFMKTNRETCRKYFIGLLETLSCLKFEYDILT
jgi:hypothetical protein